MAGFEGALSGAVGGIISSLFAGWVLHKLIAHYKNKTPLEGELGTKSIDISAGFMWALTLACWSIVLFAFVGILLFSEKEPSLWVPASGLIILFGGMGCLGLWGVQADYKVSWNEETLSGPNHLKYAMFPDRVGTVLMSDVIRIGWKASGYIYAETKDAERIFWMPYHKGYAALMQALLERHPDLEIDERVLQLL
ncbi:hypothetical protein [Hirschia litorea]|uniref:Uncharacterized protein n=1 Tax=Hirschia litorea TaxID=1199156 RepID=A0ABW2IJP9_9PROT